MKFKIDKYLLTVAREYPGFPDVNPETFAKDFLDAFVVAGMIEDPNDHWGESVLVATGPRYVADIRKVLAGFLYGDESRSIPADVFDAFCALTVIGDGDCPNCGGELEYTGTEGHELKDGDYFTPNSYVVDNYVYRCVECGETIKTPNEL